MGQSLSTVRLTHLRSSRRRQRQAGNPREMPLAERSYLQVGRPEVVAPRADAVSLVYREEADESPANREGRGKNKIRTHKGHDKTGTKKGGWFTLAGFLWDIP